MKLIFCSQNKGKLKELQYALPASIILESLTENGIIDPLPEPFDSFRENALSKAQFVYERTKKNCFAEDSGLVVPALGGAPGVHSARYAGQPTDDQANNQKLIEALEGISDRRAYYHATICLLMDGVAHYFEGRCPGQIGAYPSGEGGFGYDPLFIPEGHEATFAAIDPAEKNRISHRGKAVRAFLEFLRRAN